VVKKIIRISVKIRIPLSLDGRAMAKNDNFLFAKWSSYGLRGLFTPYFGSRLRELQA